MNAKRRSLLQVFVTHCGDVCRALADIIEDTATQSPKRACACRARDHRLQVGHANHDGFAVLSISLIILLTFWYFVLRPQRLRRGQPYGSGLVATKTVLDDQTDILRANSRTGFSEIPEAVLRPQAVNPCAG